MPVDEVSDSEPERAAERIRLQEESRAPKYGIKSNENISRSPFVLTLRPKAQHLALVPEHSVPHDGRENLSELTRPSNSSHSSASSSRSSSPPNLSRCEPRPLNIKQFACNGPSRLPSNVQMHSTSATVSARSANSSAAPRRTKTTGRVPAQRKRGATFPQTIGITDEQWARLRSCVCCEALWTTRKSTKGKMDHLRSCAKTHFASDEVVQRLILQQLDSYATNSQDIEPLNNAVDFAPKTLLDDVIEINRSPRARRIKARHPEASASNDTGSPAPPSDFRIKDLKHKHELEARNLTATKSTGPMLAQLTSTDYPGGVDDSIASHPATQMPPPSRFGKVAKGRSILSECFTGIADEPVSLLATQQLPPSRFSSTLIQSPKASLTALDSDAVLRASPLIPAQIASSYTSLFPTRKSNSGSSTRTTNRPDITSVSSSPITKTSVSSTSILSPSASTAVPNPKGKARKSQPSGTEELAQTVKAMRALNLSSDPLWGPLPSISNAAGPHLGLPASDGVAAAVENDSEDTDWGNDGVLEWDGASGEPARAISSNSPASQRRPSASSTADSNSSMQELKAIRNTNDTLHNNTATAESLTKSNSKAHSYIPLNDPTIDSIFTHMILNDEPLYLRVLRYEPIHFNVFLEKALACNVDPRGLANRLRKFLDSQCIHFQAVTAPGHNRTKISQGHPRR